MSRSVFESRRGPLKVETSKPEPPRVVLERMPAQHRTSIGCWLERAAIVIVVALVAIWVLRHL